MTAPADINSDKPASPAAIAMAQQAVRDFHECFWWWNPEFLPESKADIGEIVAALRKSGGRNAWQAAQNLVKCL